MTPGKIICVGLNYRDHAEEQGTALPERPLLFAKWPNTLIGDGDPIVLPPDASHVDAEAELAVVIGKTARHVSRDDALKHVRGYVCANDVSARDQQYGDGQWWRGKNHETFCPVGPEDPVSVKELGDGWWHVVTKFTVEGEGQDKPVCVAESVGRALIG